MSLFSWRPRNRQVRSFVTRVVTHVEISFAPVRPPGEGREESSSRTRTEGNRMADEKKSKMSRRSFLQKTAVGAAAVGAMAAAPTILKMTGNVPAATPAGDVNTPVMAYVKDAAQGTGVVMWGTQEIATRDPRLGNRLTTYARGPPTASP